MMGIGYGSITAILVSGCKHLNYENSTSFFTFLTEVFVVFHPPQVMHSARRQRGDLRNILDSSTTRFPN